MRILIPIDSDVICYVQAQQFSKMGINLVRYHNSIYNGNGAGTWQVIDNTTLYDLFFLVRFLFKRERRETLTKSPKD